MKATAQQSSGVMRQSSRNSSSQSSSSSLSRQQIPTSTDCSPVSSRVGIYSSAFKSSKSSSLSFFGIFSNESLAGSRIFSSYKSNSLLQLRKTVSLTNNSQQLLDASSFIQYAMLLAIAFRLPSLLDQVADGSVNLNNYRGFPLLIVLGLLPGVILNRTQKSNNSRCSLKEIEEYYRKTMSNGNFDVAGNRGNANALANSSNQDSHDWGHFAEIDPSDGDFSCFDTGGLMLLNATARGNSTLLPLQEGEEDDDSCLS